jgi:hypothetical protein
LRPVLRVPSRAGTEPPKRAPIARVTGRLNAGASITTPAKTSSTPPPRTSHNGSFQTFVRRRTRKAIPVSSTIRLAMVMRRSGLSGTAALRIAAIGGTREARSAGTRAEMTVTRTPTRSVAMITYGWTTMPLTGRSVLASASSPVLPSQPTPKPTSRPTIAAARPSSADSASTERSTCCLDAPNDR